MENFSPQEGGGGRRGWAGRRNIQFFYADVSPVTYRGYIAFGGSSISRSLTCANEKQYYRKRICLVHFSVCTLNSSHVLYTSVHTLNNKHVLYTLESAHWTTDTSCTPQNSHVEQQKRLVHLRPRTLNNRHVLYTSESTHWTTDTSCTVHPRVCTLNNRHVLYTSESTRWTIDTSCTSRSPHTEQQTRHAYLLVCTLNSRHFLYNLRVRTPILRTHSAWLHGLGQNSSSMMVVFGDGCVLTLWCAQVSRGGELRTQKLKSHLFLNTELKDSPFKAWSRSVYSYPCYAYCQGFLLRYFHTSLVHSPACFPKPLPSFSCVDCG